MLAVHVSKFPAALLLIVSEFDLTLAQSGNLVSIYALLIASAAGVGIVIGFVLTGTGLGQLLGPIVLTQMIEWAGHWYAGGLVSLVVGALGVIFARWLSRLSTTCD